MLKLKKKANVKHKVASKNFKYNMNEFTKEELPK